METQAIERLQKIHHLWLGINTDFSTKYHAAFRSNKTMTSYIDEIVSALALRLELLVCPEYYFLDYALYCKEDLVPHNASTWKKGDSIWLKRIRVAFEHENKLDGSAGGYQEFSHLMLTNADAKVLVGYGESGDSYDPYAIDYQNLMSGLNKDPDPILFIGEYAPIAGVDNLRFESYIITSASVYKYCANTQTGSSWGPIGMLW